MELTDTEWSLISNALRDYARSCDRSASDAKKGDNVVIARSYELAAFNARELAVRVETEQGV